MTKLKLHVRGWGQLCVSSSPNVMCWGVLMVKLSYQCLCFIVVKERLRDWISHQAIDLVKIVSSYVTICLLFVGDILNIGIGLLLFQCLFKMQSLWLQMKQGIEKTTSHWALPFYSYSLNIVITTDTICNTAACCKIIIAVLNLNMTSLHGIHPFLIHPQIK